MAIIFDAHNHCFPPMGSGDLDVRVPETQYHVRHAWSRFMRRGDNVPLSEPVLFGDGDGFSWQPDVQFRFGRFGQVELTHNGDDYFFQLVPASLFDSSAPPEFTIAQMDFAGVDRAVLQHDRIYGRLDDYLGECVKRYSDRLVALAQVDEWVGGEPEQLERLRRQVEDLGFSGLYFPTEGFFHTDFRTHVNSSELEPLWELVGELGIPIHWHAVSLRRPRLEMYLKEIEEFTTWGRAHPDIPSVLTHGLENLRIDIGGSARFTVPREIRELLDLPNWHLELMLHKMAFDHEFPPYHPEIPNVVRTLVDDIGAEKLMWGSDMPSCEEVVTYRQSQLLWRTGCDFLTDNERDGILGGNLARLYPLKG